MERRTWRPRARRVARLARFQCGGRLTLPHPRPLPKGRSRSRPRFCTWGRQPPRPKSGQPAHLSQSRLTKSDMTHHDARPVRKATIRIAPFERSAARSKPPGAVLKIAMLTQRRARCQNGLPLGRRSCDGARATSSVSTVATLAPRSQESRRQVKSLHEVLQCHHSRAVIDAW